MSHQLDYLVSLKKKKKAVVVTKVMGKYVSSVIYTLPYD